MHASRHYRIKELAASKLFVPEHGLVHHALAPAHQELGFTATWRHIHSQQSVGFDGAVHALHPTYRVELFGNILQHLIAWGLRQFVLKFGGKNQRDSRWSRKLNGRGYEKSAFLDKYLAPAQPTLSVASRAKLRATNEFLHSPLTWISGQFGPRFNNMISASFSTYSERLTTFSCNNTNRHTLQQKHSQSANLRQRQNLNHKWSGIRMQIFGLIQIRLSVGSVSKCRECIILSATVKKMKKWSGIHTRIRITTKS